MNWLKHFSLNNPSDTRILEITATSTDPQMAMDLAETMAEEAIDYLPDTMSTLAPNLAQHAKLPESKVAPSYTKFTMIGALLGLLICAAFFIVKYLWMTPSILQMIWKNILGWYLLPLSLTAIR